MPCHTKRWQGRQRPTCMPMPRRQCVESQRICETELPLQPMLALESPCLPPPAPCSVPLPCRHSRFPGPTCYSGNSCSPSPPACQAQSLVTQKRSKFKNFKKKGPKKSSANHHCHRPCRNAEDGNSSQTSGSCLLQQDSDQSIPCYDPNQDVCPAEIVPLCLEKAKCKRATAPCAQKAQIDSNKNNICPAEKKKKHKHTPCSAPPRPCYDIPCQTGPSCTSIKNTKRNLKSRPICAIPPEICDELPCGAKSPHRSVSFDCSKLGKVPSCKPLESPCGKQSQTKTDSKKSKKSRKDKNINTGDKFYCECATSTSSTNLKSDQKKSGKKRWTKDAATSGACHSATQSETSLRNSHSQTGVVAVACSCGDDNADAVNQSMSGDGIAQNKSQFDCKCSEDDVNEKEKKELKDASCTCAFDEVVSAVEPKAVMTSEVGLNACDCEGAEKTQCNCHFPPAFNQISCTGNISGVCNCEQKTKE